MSFEKSPLKHFLDRNLAYVFVLPLGLSFVTSTANELVHQHGITDFHVVAVCRDQAQLQAYLDLLPSRSKEGNYRLSTYSTGLPVVADTATEPLLSRIQEVDEEKQEKLQSTGGGCCSSRAAAASARLEQPEISLAGGQTTPFDEDYDNDKMGAVDSDVAVPPRTLQVKDIKAARPDLKTIIQQEVKNAIGSRLAIVACGPDSFMRDVQDQVALLQMDILMGRSKVNEVYLRSEAFHW